ncbi:hypothetical protein GEW_13626, partial [Pasteurella multocida subsp. gallicida str. Anand1_poultry]
KGFLVYHKQKQNEYLGLYWPNNLVIGVNWDRTIPKTLDQYLPILDLNINYPISLLFYCAIPRFFLDLFLLKSL